MVLGDLMLLWQQKALFAKYLKHTFISGEDMDNSLSSAAHDVVMAIN